VIPEIKQPEGEPSLSVYPNPSATDNLKIRVTLRNNDVPADIKLVDMMGKSIYKRTFTAEQLLGEVTITPDAPLLNGIYIVMVNQGSIMVNQKVVIKK
jgi:hypothetical protein